MNKPPAIDVSERRARLAARHHLAPSRRTDDVTKIVEDLVAMHSSDPVTVYVGVAMRMEHPAIEPISRALYDDRTLVRHHAMRRTLWVLTPEIARLAHAACTEALVANERKRLIRLIEDGGVSENGAAWLDGARRDVLTALERLGATSARKLGDEVPELRMPLYLAPGKAYAATVQAHTRVLLLLGFEGSIVRARPMSSWTTSEYQWTTMESWLPGGVGGGDPIAASTELATRWLRSFGPATAADLQWWTGWTGAAAKAALARSGAEEVQLDGKVGWVAAGDARRSTPPEPWVALLPALDPTTMGWKERDWYLPPALVPALFDRNGNAGPTIWVDGEIVGGWIQRPTGEIAHRVLADVGRERLHDIEEAIAALERLIDGARVNVRFPAPLQRELLS